MLALLTTSLKLLTQSLIHQGWLLTLLASLKEDPGFYVNYN